MRLWGRHSIAYEEDVTIRIIAEWLNHETPTESISSAKRTGWFEREEILRCTARVLLLFLFTVLVFWQLSVKYWG
jgi:hypothetical protein